LDCDYLLRPFNNPLNMAIIPRESSTPPERMRVTPFIAISTPPDRNMDQISLVPLTAAFSVLAFAARREPDQREKRLKVSDAATALARFVFTARTSV